MAKGRCALCGSDITGRSVEIWTQLITNEPPSAPYRQEYAHPECARMLEDDENSEEDDDDG